MSCDPAIDAVRDFEHVACPGHLQVIRHPPGVSITLNHPRGSHGAERRTTRRGARERIESATEPATFAESGESGDSESDDELDELLDELDELLEEAVRLHAI